MLFGVTLPGFETSTRRHATASRSRDLANQSAASGRYGARCDKQSRVLGGSGGGTRDVNNGDVHDSSDDDQTEVKSAYSPHLSSRVDNPDVEAIQTDFARQTHIGDATVATHVYDDVTYVGAHVKNKYNVDAKLMSGSRKNLFSKRSADVRRCRKKNTELTSKLCPPHEPCSAPTLMTIPARAIQILDGCVCQQP